MHIRTFQHNKYFICETSHIQKRLFYAKCNDLSRINLTASRGVIEFRRAGSGSQRAAEGGVGGFGRNEQGRGGGVGGSGGKRKRR